MDVRKVATRGGRVLLVSVLVLFGIAYARDAVTGLQKYGRGGAALALLQCVLAVSSWALAAFLWRLTRPRRPRPAGDSPASPPGSPSPENRPADRSVDPPVAPPPPES